jgi:hypothetical protein
MKTTTYAAAFVAALPAAMAQLTINSPSASSLVFCQPLLWTFSGGTPPYIITLVAPGQGAIYETLTNGTGTTEPNLTWVVDLAPGSNFNGAIKDATGAQQFTSTLTVQSNPQPSTTCTPNNVAIGGAPPPSSSAGAGGASSSAAGTGAGASTTPASGSNTSSKPAGTAASDKGTGTSGTAGAKPTGSGASRVAVGMTGLAALVGFAAMLV